MNTAMNYIIKLLTIAGNVAVVVIGIVMLAMGIFGGRFSIEIEGIKKLWE